MGQRPKNKPDQAASEDRGGLPTISTSADHALVELSALAEEFCAVLELNAASVVYGINNRWRVLATHNTTRAFCSYPNTPKTSPFRINERLIVPNVAENLLLRRRLARTSLKFDLHNWRAVVRLPFPIGPQEWFAITGHARSSKESFPAGGLKRLRRIEEKAGALCRALLPELRAFGDRPGFPLTLSELVARVEASSQAIAVDNENFEMIAGSPAISAFLGKSPRELKGSSLAQLVGGFAEPIGLLFKNAIETGFTSPDIEVNMTDLGATSGNFEQHASPVYVRDRDKPVLLVHYARVGELSRLPLTIVGGKAHWDDGSSTEDFLMETLSKHRTIRSRAGTAYITLRSWVNSIKTHQIRALKAIKSHKVDNFAESIADEMQLEIDRIAGFQGFTAIVPVPGGHSRSGNSLSTAIARSLSKRVQLPVIQVFDHLELAGTSHPKSNLSRPRMIARVRLTQPVILVDDVVTSGLHMEECISQLRHTCKTVLAVAWISGRPRKG